MKSCLNHKDFFVVSVCVAVLGLMGAVFAGEIFPDVNYAGVEEPNHAAMPEYVKNKIIVKFRGSAAETIEMGLAKDKAAHELELSDSLDKLNNKYGLKKAKPLFKNFKSNRRQVQALLTKDKALLTKKEKHLLGRLKRAPRDTKVPDLSRIYKLELELEAGQSLEDVVAAYNKNPDVEYAELDYIVSIGATPNDPLYSIQWPLNNTGQMYPESGGYNHPPGKPDCDIDAPEAWDIHTGGPEIVVAVIDTGVDYNHRDLQGNMWVNSDEIPSNGVDDDENGYVDDVYGYDFINDDSDPIDDHGHGTHCSGIIAADGDNGLDITGVCWDARIMGLKFLGADGYGDTEDAISAFYYAVENGADVTSNSWGGGGYSQAMEEAIDYAYSQGVVMVAAAGNDDSDSPFYPAYYDHMIAVAATDSADQKASFSNYGNWVDIAAPGVDVLSLRADGTSMGTTYDDYTTIASGTSMACPHFAGACALLLSFNTTLTNDDVYDILMGTVDPIADGICLSDGRLNIYNAILEAITSKGFIILDDNYYACSNVIGIQLVDSDLAGVSSQEVTLTTNGGDLETVTLTETNSLSVVFTGTISTISGDPDVEDGIVQVAHGQIMIVTYEDADDGTGNPAIVTDLAETDCQSPAIFNVGIDAPGPEPTVTFETDEPTTARVLCGLSCSEPNDIIATDSTLGTTHTLQLAGVLPETDYHFIIEATDAVGNESVDDNAGGCYSFTTTGAGDDIYVPGQFPIIQEAIDRCWDGGTVWVADGVYTGDGNRDLDFHGKAVRVKSETGPENCIIDCNGTRDDRHRGFYFHNGEDANSVLDGFTIINGYHLSGGAIWCSGSSPMIMNCIVMDSNASHDGGGIFCLDSSPTIENCTIIGNLAGWRGGGICCKWDSSPTITNCTISGNSSNELGGAIYCDYSNPTITKCTISGNSTKYGGGGIYCGGSSPTIIDCIISGNSTKYYGGGIHCEQESSPTIINCIISGNSTRDDGGAIYCYYYSNPTITNCTISGNSAEYHGGGIFCGQSNPTITNCTVSNNSAGWGGGISCLWESSPTITNCNIIGNKAVDNGDDGFGGGILLGEGNPTTITNCTITGNTAGEYGGGVSCHRGTFIFTNCILWGNEAPKGPELYLAGDSNALVNYTDVQGGQADVYIEPGGTLDWGPGNIDLDPLFALATDYHLLPGSPCIDAGTNDPCGGLPATDRDGVPRPLDGDGDANAVADMGAYEYAPNSPAIAVSALSFYFVQDWPKPDPQMLLIRNCGGRPLNWEIVEDCSWLEVAPANAVSADQINEVTITVDPNGLTPALYTCTFNVQDANASNSPVTIRVTMPVGTVLPVPSPNYPTIQAAIDAADNYDVVLVADGNYTGNGNKNLDFRGKAITVCSENGPNNCTIDCENSGRGFRFRRGEDENSVLDGFTITNGDAREGGGILCTESSSPTIRNCTINNNTGGGIYCEYYSNPTITNCTINNNTGGGISCWESNPTITKCTISGNSAGYGGGIACVGGNLTINNCTIAKMKAAESPV